MNVLFAAMLFGQIQLLPPEEIGKIHGLLPKIEDKILAATIRSARTLWYDESVLPIGYQDSIAPYTGIRNPQFPLVSGAFTSSPGLTQIFEQDGSGFIRLPFGRTGGTHRCTNVLSTKFLVLPFRKDKGKRGQEPVVVWREGLTYKWSFPVGTITGELLTMISDSKTIAFEIRLRRREADHWAPEVLRPFPEAGDLVRALVKHAPKETKLLRWATSSENLTSAVLQDHLGVLQATGAVDPSPRFRKGLVGRLLSITPFKSSAGRFWKQKGEVVAYAASSDHNESIVPAGYDAGTLSIDVKTCNSCHQHTGAPIGQFNGNAALYGSLWGSDTIWSFNPFEPAVVAANGDYTGNELRQSFLTNGVIELYDPTKHSTDQYPGLIGK